MSYSGDPISIVQVAMLNEIKSSSAVRSIVQNYGKNFICFDKETDNRKDNIDESDLPEVVQVLVGNDVQLNPASGEVGMQVRFEIQMNSGSFDVVGEKGLNALQFAVYCALLQCQFGEDFNALTWAGRRFIGDVIIAGANSSDSNVIENRGIRGWTTIANANVTMFLPRDKMLEYNTTGEMP